MMTLSVILRAGAGCKPLAVSGAADIGSDCNANREETVKPLAIPDRIVGEPISPRLHGLPNK